MLRFDSSGLYSLIHASNDDCSRLCRARPGVAMQARPVVEDLLEEALRGDPAARAQREPIVVARDALHHPQARRVRLARVVEVEQRLRRDALAVPRVEQLVREQLEQALVGFARRREVRVVEVHARRAVLEAAVRVVREHQEERVVGERRLAEPRDVIVDDRARDPRRGAARRTAARRALAPDRELHRHLRRHGERARRRRGGSDDRRARRSSAARRRRSASRAASPSSASSRRGRELDLDRRACACAVGIQERRRAVQERVVVVDVVRADGQVVAVDRVANGELARAGARRSARSACRPW